MEPTSWRTSPLNRNNNTKFKLIKNYLSIFLAYHEFSGSFLERFLLCFGSFICTTCALIFCKGRLLPIRNNPHSRRISWSYSQFSDVLQNFSWYAPESIRYGDVMWMRGYKSNGEDTNRIFEVKRIFLRLARNRKSPFDSYLEYLSSWASMTRTESICRKWERLSVAWSNLREIKGKFKKGIIMNYHR